MEELKYVPGRKRPKNRVAELAELFIEGKLPEQNGKIPPSRWCIPCKGKGQLRAIKYGPLESCKICDGTGVIRL